MKTKILVVCAGNICRSPLAEGILRERVAADGLDLEVDSAASNAWHTGAPPDARATVAARLKGFDISDLRARPFRPSDFEDFDLVLVMDHQNRRDLEAMRPNGNATPLKLITSYSDSPGVQDAEVPDPYFSGQFNPVIDMLSDSIEGLLAALKPS
ncbi:protein-tyrosine phosphatase [Litoreibacter ponti]|uniref:protein-tyrosine-phosphatase n=1 Tax=Litoreibacter ponti TaxID=1510457 RepID=A0A2T6BKY3_9RHOB|nr:low molecular weight protein-tyrosine-phosphatase [Litoreibacter ponti]PTX56716.1 protein-tyrosine phosphatase [Litoreibacter ponti]